MNPKAEARLLKAARGPGNANVNAHDAQQRVFYSHMPHTTVSQPPPVVIKEETSFGQHLKAGLGQGAGAAVGVGVVSGLFSALGSLFE
jgi:hypothetical protein